MVDQTKVGGGNGAATTAPRAVVHNTAELFADAITLAELQFELLRCDWQAFLSRLIWPLVLLIASLLLLASCVPVALVCASLALYEITTPTLSPAQAFAITLGVALVLGGAVALISASYLRRGLSVWQRSQLELANNVRWIKRMIHRLGHPGARPSRREEATHAN